MNDPLARERPPVPETILEKAQISGPETGGQTFSGKQRHGPIGTVDLGFEGRFTRFGNLVKPWQSGGGDGFG